MRYSKKTFINEFITWIMEKFDSKCFGTFGFEITLHEGLPISITKTERLTYKRVEGGIESTD